jgi:hypothetical protein
MYVNPEDIVQRRGLFNSVNVHLAQSINQMISFHIFKYENVIMKMTDG